ncbi:toxin-antitoxin system YwqK family antitoxin [Mucilaginibacter sp. 22184]|uniref:toxin-antitoxin system YwqK family antitoxin n=1 Tax=Mucilaginibacter sp. 22184 TaxID=3453887 RepID=UPI003F840088
MKQLLLSILLLFPALVRAQQIPGDGTSQVRINDTDRMIRAGILAISATPKTIPDRLYYWYGSGGIHQTQGGYSGHLLHGVYEEYFLNKNLRMQGTFAGGLKDGIWKEWNETGKMSRLVTWVRGEQNGPFQWYTTDGKVSTSGYYKHDLWDGTITFHMGTDSVKTLRYKSGKVLPPGKGNILKRLHLFQKKKESAVKPAV